MHTDGLPPAKAGPATIATSASAMSAFLMKPHPLPGERPRRSVWSEVGLDHQMFPASRVEGVLGCIAQAAIQDG